MQQNETAFKLKFGVTDNNSCVRSHVLIILLFPSPFNTNESVKKEKALINQCLQRIINKYQTVGRRIQHLSYL